MNNVVSEQILAAMTAEWNKGENMPVHSPREKLAAWVAEWAKYPDSRPLQFSEGRLTLGDLRALLAELEALRDQVHIWEGSHDSDVFRASLQNEEAHRLNKPFIAYNGQWCVEVPCGGCSSAYSPYFASQQAAFDWLTKENRDAR